MRACGAGSVVVGARGRRVIGTLHDSSKQRGGLTAPPTLFCILGLYSGKQDMPERGLRKQRVENSASAHQPYRLS